MTDREIQFVRARMGDECRDVSDADIADGLQNTLYLERVRFTIATDDFVSLIWKVVHESGLYRLLYRLVEWLSSKLNK